MKPLTLLVVLPAAASFAVTDDIIPKAFPKDRYADTVKNSPFRLETKVAETPAEQKVNPFQNLYLRGIGTADGKDYVLVQRLGEERPMRFIGNEPNTEGLAVKSVRRGNNFRETKVVLAKGGETGEVGFKEDTINAPPPAAGGPAGRGPALPGMPGGIPKPGGNPSLQVPAVRVTAPPLPGAGVPRPSTSAPMPTAPMPPGAPMPGGTQTRVRSNGIRN